MGEISSGVLFIVITILLIILISVQLTLNLILRELKEIRKYLSYVRDYRNDK